LLFSPIIKHTFFIGNLKLVFGVSRRAREMERKRFEKRHVHRSLPFLFIALRRVCGGIYEQRENEARDNNKKTRQKMKQHHIQKLISNSAHI
jgi:hypothetical protein